jgi:hypothetical protein
MSMFAPATRKKLKLRMALDGPSGSGKTYSALRFAFGLTGPKGRIAVIDTEHRSASKYKGVSPDGYPWEFQVCELEHYAPSGYTQVIKEAGRLGFDVLIIDSLSHAWDGVGGALELVDKKAAQNNNSFTAWKDVTPMHREMIEAILSCPCHVIATMRSKMEYAIEKDERTGKMVPRKVGMAPVQRQGMEYEFDVVCDLDVDHILTVSKTRCSEIDGARVVKPQAAWMMPLAKWLDEGEEPAAAAVQAQPPQASANSPTTAAQNVAQESVSPMACTDEQRQKILALAQQAKMSIEDLKKEVAKHGAASTKQLTWAAAGKLMDTLSTRAAEAPF